MTRGFPERPGFDTAVSRALLLRAARGDIPRTLRLHRPGAVVAFGRRDAVHPRLGDAVDAARRQGFASVLRLAGGRAAVFHPGTIAFAHTVPDPQPTARTFARFEEMAALIAQALRGIGVDARVGEVPGEYCPGDHSVNARGAVKLAGIGQRLVAGAAHVGGVLVVSDHERVARVLIPVYDLLGLRWDPSTAGSVAAEVGAGWDEVCAALRDAFARRYDLYEDDLDPATLALAERLEPEHRLPASA